MLDGHVSAFAFLGRVLVYLLVVIGTSAEEFMH